jgi:hypothetical protein
MTSLARPVYVQAVRDDVCSVCVAFSVNKKNPRICEHESDDQCPIFKRLDRAIQIVGEQSAGAHTQKSLELMKEVCLGCSSADEKGFCHLMEARTRTSSSWCVLEAYFGLLIGAIESINRRIRSRPRI